LKITSGNPVLVNSTQDVGYVTTTLCFLNLRWICLLSGKVKFLKFFLAFFARIEKRVHEHLVLVSHLQLMDGDEIWFVTNRRHFNEFFSQVVALKEAANG